MASSQFFQHHCYITAKIPRVHCKTHGVRLIEVPWARPGSGFTLLFEEVALTLVREMPVNAAAKFMEVTDKRLWRVVEHYVEQALSRLDLSSLQAFGFDETASKRGHNYVTVFRLFDVSSGFQYFSGRARYHVDHGDESGCISIASSPRPRGLK